MSSDQNNQESLLKIVQDNQKSQIWMSITSAINGVVGLFTTLTLIREAYKKKKASPKVRLIRKQGDIAKTRLRHKAEIERKHLELKTLEQEAAYEAQVSQYQAGLTSQPEKPDPEPKETNQGKGNKPLEETADKVQSGMKQAKGVADQFKGLKDKIFGSDKEK